MKANLRFLRSYLYVVVVIALLGIADAILTYLKITPSLYVRIIPLILFLFFFFNIFAIAIFRRHHLLRIMYVLPVYHIFSYIFFLSLGLYIIITGFSPEWLNFTLISIQAASSLFELSLSIYLLTKPDSSPAQ